jgi:hypothetical protein
MRLQRAYKSLAVATETFEQLRSSLPCKYQIAREILTSVMTMYIQYEVPVMDSDVKQWIDDEKFVWTSNSPGIHNNSVSLAITASVDDNNFRFKVVEGHIFSKTPEVLQTQVKVLPV